MRMNSLWALKKLEENKAKKQVIYEKEIAWKANALEFFFLYNFYVVNKFKNDRYHPVSERASAPGWYNKMLRLDGHKHTGDTQSTWDTQLSIGKCLDQSAGYTLV